MNSESNKRQLYLYSLIVLTFLFFFPFSFLNLFREFALTNLVENFFETGSSSAGCNSALNTLYPPLPYIFWTSWTWGFTRYHLKYTIPIKKIWANRDWVIVFFFSKFWWFPRSGAKFILQNQLFWFFECFFWFFVWNHIASNKF